MHFINQEMQDKFDETLLANIDSDYGQDINRFAINLANLIENNYFNSVDPIEEWMFNNARDLEFTIDEGLTSFQVDCAEKMLEEAWIFGRWLRPAIKAKEQEVINGVFKDQS